MDEWSPENITIQDLEGMPEHCHAGNRTEYMNLCDVYIVLLQGN